MPDYVYTVGVSSASVREQLVPIVIECKPKAVLDLGCGVGVYGREIKKRNENIQMIGWDGCFKYLTSVYCQKHYDQLIWSNLEKQKHGEIFVRGIDVILFCDVLEHLPRAVGQRYLADFLTFDETVFLTTPMFDFKQDPQAVKANPLEEHKTYYKCSEICDHGWTLIFTERWESKHGEGEIGVFRNH